MGSDSWRAKLILWMDTTAVRIKWGVKENGQGAQGRPLVVCVAQLETGG